MSKLIDAIKHSNPIEVLVFLSIGGTFVAAIGAFVIELLFGRIFIQSR